MTFSRTLITAGAIFFGSMSFAVAGEGADSPTLTFKNDWTLTFDGQYRIRGIADTGVDFVDDDGRQNVSHRARLGTTMTTDQGVKVRFMLQDVRIWGEELNTLNDFSADGLDVRAAWMALPLGEVGSLKLGRQAFSLDDQRIIGAVGWSQRARAFDGGVLKLGVSSIDAQLFGFQITERDGRGGDGQIANPRGNEVELVGAHVRGDFGDALKVSALAISDLIEDAGRTTVGLHLTGKAAGAHYTGSFYYQSAEVGGETGSSTLIAARAGYTLDTAWKPSITGWFEQLSGDGTPEGTFATPYATNHKFYGEMDLFLNTVLHTGALGLQDIGGRLMAKPADRLKVLVDVHAFSSVEPGPDDATSFGLETDIKAVMGLGKGLDLAVLYAVFSPGDLIEARAGGSELEHFGYLTLDARF